jgi:glycerol-3-phosphate dehydrogenase
VLGGVFNLCGTKLINLINLGETKKKATKKVNYIKGRILEIGEVGKPFFFFYIIQERLFRRQMWSKTSMNMQKRWKNVSGANIWLHASFYSSSPRQQPPRQWLFWGMGVGVCAVAAATYAMNMRKSSSKMRDTGNLSQTLSIGVSDEELFYNRKRIYAEAENGSVTPTANRFPSRDEHLKALKSDQEYDILVVGGGATGCGVALDAASRGLNVALVERDDFSSGTSSRSTKLVHGGVRYLEKAIRNLDYEQYILVKQALHERAVFLTIAPHLSHQLPIMLPIYTWWQVPYFWIGSKIYDLLSGKERLESSYYLSKTKALEKFPMLKRDNLVGAMVYYDGQHNDSRMNVALVLTAISEGATVANHVEILELLKKKDEPDGKERLCGALLRDNLTNETWNVRAKCIINATGPFTDSLRKMDNDEREEIITPSSGIHIILPNYYGSATMGLIDPATSDGRVIFFLPWQNNTVVGTTDTPTSITLLPQPREDEIDFLLKSVSNYLSSDIQVRRGDVLAAWAGIRPLVRNPNAKHTQELVRNHLVLVSEKGLITIAGGKWTTYRQMAEDAVDKAVELFHLKPKSSPRTQTLMLVGAHEYTPLLFVKLIQTYGIARDVAEHLVSSYGDRAFEVVQYAKLTGKRWPVLGQRLHELFPYIDAEVYYAIHHEYACTVVDFIARRSRIAFLNASAAMDVVPKVIDIMGDELKWNKDRKRKEFEAARQFLITMGLEDLSGPSEFNAMELVHLRKQFSLLDTNGDGSISVDDLCTLIDQSQIKIKDEELHKYITEFDKNRNGTLEFNEFLMVSH